MPESLPQKPPKSHILAPFCRGTGARLDGLAGLVSAAACLVKTVPAVRLDAWLLVWMVA